MPNLGVPGLSYAYMMRLGADDRNLRQDLQDRTIEPLTWPANLYGSPIKH